MNELYDYLINELGFSCPEDVEIYIKQNSMENIEAIIEFIIKVFSMTESLGTGINNSIFNFKVNSSLSGGGFPCSELSCRMKNLESLIRFSVLYAEKVIIKNPMDKHYSNLQNNELFLEELYIDICILLELKELVINEIVVFESSYVCLCQNCLTQVENKKKKILFQMDKTYDLMSQRFENNTLCKAISYNNMPEIVISGSEEFDLHETFAIPSGNQLEYIESILKKTNNVGRNLSPTEIKSLGLSSKFISPSYDDVLLNTLEVVKNQTSYLTNRRLDYSFLADLNQQQNTQMDLLNHSLTVVPEVKISKIMELRKKEGGAFENYRVTVSKELQGRNFNSSQEYVDFNKDVIVPEIEKMNRALEVNRKYLFKDITKDIIFYSGVLAVGSFAGGIVASASQLLSAIGGVSSIKKLYDKSFSNDTQKEIAKNPYYFLWKLKG
ncbi:hypothetical protein [Enterococcus crotali]|uniref:hypothetical protein n=1 Tax=Enterococcus crotali TaxID=1453587 RepID=UPI00046FE53D|nr:hypothetical protein [Enterococcus crotali]